MKSGDVVGERFELEELAGTGGMGAVFRAYDRATGERVALKMLRGAAAVDGGERFAREIRVLAALRHPGIVRYVADGRTEVGALWLAMEWLDGESLSDRIAREGLTAGESVDLARRIAEALGAAHDKNIVHRDVKPSNLFLPDGDLARIKVLDFGVARMVDVRSATGTGVMIGTPGYMAPEQVRGEREVSARVDVFAIGALLFECLTGRPAFVGEHVLGVLAKIILEDAPRVRELRPDLPDALDDLVARALARSPDDRPRSGVQLAAELAQLDRIDAPGGRPTGLRAPALTQTERRLLCVVVIGVDTDRPLVGDETITGELPDHALLTLRAAAAVHGGDLERLADGSYVVTVSGSGGAADHVVQAARCALALRAVVPASPMALATGRGVMAGRWPVGEAINRAVALLVKPTPHIRIDEITAGLLDTRFEVGGDAAGLLLVAERDAVEVSRTLLGKATPCVGRDRELALLAGYYDECIAEPLARAVLITGAAGVGKSRVRFELLRRVREQPGGAAPEVWIGRGDALRAGSPFGMIAPALRRAAGILDGEPAEVRRHKLRARVQRNARPSVPAEELARTTWFLGELVGAPFPDDDLVELRAARGDPMLMNDQVQRAFVHFLALETAAQPVVIVLEDLHWGDLPTTKLVDAALRALPEAPWLVIALARPEVHELFPRLWAERGVQELRLDELTRKGAERLVRGVLGELATETLVARVVAQAGGNSFYLEELIRAVADGKGDAMPETVLAVVQGRLDRLEVDARAVLRAASVFGQQFWRGGIAALLGEAREANARQWLDELVARELIARAPAPKFPAEDEYLFRHALVREAAYAMLTDADRKLGHQLAGDWLAHAGEADAMVLGEHFERGGDRPRASDAYRRAAEDALAACDFRAAIARAERGVACGALTEALGALRLTQAEAHKWCGEWSPAAAHAHEAMSLLRPAGARWFAAAGEAAEASGKLDDVDALVAVGEALRDAPEDPAVAALPRVVSTTVAAFALFTHGLFELAQVLLDRVELHAGDLPDPNVLARVYQARSSRAMYTGDAGAYLESELAAAEAFTRAGDRRFACTQRGHVGYACLEIGAYAEAEEYLRGALAAGEELGLATVVATAKHNLGRALQMRGALDAALAIELEALAMFRAHGDRRLAIAARTYAAFILADLGELARAEAELRASLEHALGPIRPQILAGLARVQLARGAAGDALATARQAHDVLEELGGVEEGESLVRLALAECLLATDDRAGACAQAARARDRVLERAAKISDPAWRTSFLERGADNARTLALAAELGV